MLAILQYPFVDLRRISKTSANIIPVPDWNHLDESQKNFVKYFGPVRERHSGGIHGLFNEGHFVGARRAIRFDSLTKIPELKYLGKLGNSWKSKNFWIAFRRLYFDAEMTGRIEIGFVTHQEISDTEIRSAVPIACSIQDIHKALAKMKVRVRSPEPDGYTIAPLLDLRTALRNLILSATSFDLQTELEKPSDRLRVGSPLIYVRATKSDKLNYNGLSVAGSYVGNTVVGGTTAPDGLRTSFWIQKSTVDTISREPSDERSFRILLSKLNSEQYALAALSKALDEGLAEKVANADSINIVQNFVKRWKDNVQGLDLDSAHTYADVASTTPHTSALFALLMNKPGSDATLRRHVDRALIHLADRRKQIENQKDLMDYVAATGKWIDEYMKSFSQAIGKGVGEGLVTKGR